MEPQGLSSARTLDWTLEKTLERTPDWALERAPERAPERTPERTPEQAPERTPEQAPEQAPEWADQAWRHRPPLPLGGRLQLLRASSRCRASRLLPLGLHGRPSPPVLPRVRP